LLLSFPFFGAIIDTDVGRDHTGFIECRLGSYHCCLCVGTISYDECKVLNDILGVKTPNGCYSLNRRKTNDAFTYENDDPFQGEDATKHRNSWLMPKLARRMTKNNPHHVSKWHKQASVNNKECSRIQQCLKESIGASNDDEVFSKLPKACQDMLS